MEPAKESIFSSTIRAFCKAFAVIIGISIAFIPVALIFGMLGNEANSSEKTTAQFLPDLNGNSQMLSSSTPAVLQINIHGIIGKDDGLGVTADDIRWQLIESRQGVLKNNRVKAVLLHIKTPGGSATDSDTIYHLISDYKKKYKVPVYAFIDGICASGGMYSAAPSDKIYSMPVSIIGSIGVVVGPFFNFQEVMTKIGIKSLTITEGKDKDMLNPFREWKPGEDASLKAVGSFLYKTFVDDFTSARPQVDKTKLMTEYGAQIFDPIKAEQIGYIDVADATYEKTLHDLLLAANIDPKKPYQVIELKLKKKWLQELFRSESPLFTGKIKHEVQLGGQGINETFSYIYEPGNTNPILLK